MSLMERDNFSSGALSSNELRWIIEYVAQKQGVSYQQLSSDEKKQVDVLVERRVNGEPLAYILKSVPFLDISIEVNEDVLIPRPETEQLAGIIIEELSAIDSDLKGKFFVDLCTGSGCIAIAVKKKFPMLNVIGIDISHKALKVAQINSESSKVDVQWVESDLLSHYDGEIDFLVSNPPYISEEEFEDLDLSVKNYEPKLALVASNNGLHCYQKIFNQVQNLSCLPKKIWMEIGHTQASSLIKLVDVEVFSSSNIKIEKDFFGKDRFFFLECD